MTIIIQHYFFQSLSLYNHAGIPASQPFFSSEVQEHGYSDEGHDEHYQRISPAPFKLRHVFKIHAVNAGHEGKRHEYRRDNRQNFHHRVYSVADARKIDIEEAGEDVAECLDGFDDADGMIVDIPQINMH